MSNDKARAELALEKIGLLYDVEREADERNLNYEERSKLRMEVSVPILMGFEAWLQESTSMTGRSTSWNTSTNTTTTMAATWPNCCPAH